MNSWVKALAAFLLLSMPLLAGSVSAYSQSNLQRQYGENNGFYCENKDTKTLLPDKGVGFKLFSYEINPDKTLRFAVSVYYSDLNEASFGVFAPHAKPVDPDKWRYEVNLKSANSDDRCAVDVSLIENKSWLIEKDPATSCSLYQGARVHFGHIRFYKESRMDSVTPKGVATQLWNIDTWNHVLNCTSKGAVPKPIGNRTP